MSKNKRLNAPVTFTTNFEAIDAEKGVIRGVVICQEGEAKGHGVLLNRQFIRDVVSFGKEFGDVGVKSRFGHPNMCSDALGTYLGRYKNFRLREHRGEETPYQAVADLYLDESSKVTPNGDLYSYILKLAETAPEHFGNSIVFSMGELIEKKEKDEAGNETRLLYATIKQLHESDLVDSPAATEGLFSGTSAELAEQVTYFLDNNPQVFEVVSKNPGIIEEFMSKYDAYKNKHVNHNFNSMKKFLMKNFPTIAKVLGYSDTEEREITVEDMEKTEGALAERDQQITELTQERDEAKQALTDAQAAHTSALAEKDQTISGLNTKVTDLEAENTRLQAGQTKTTAKDDPSLGDKDTQATNLAAADEDAKSFRD